MKIKYIVIACMVICRFIGADPVEFAIVAPTYNNMSLDPKTQQPLCVEHIKSIAKQKYPHALFKVYCIDDYSTDGTAETLKRYVQTSGLSDIATVTCNTQRKKALYNLWRTIHDLPDHVVVVTLDGDDPLPHSHVLTRLAQEYQNPDVWLTYGQFKHYPSGRMGHCANYPEDVIRNAGFRKYDWLASHVRTFKAGLFKKIRLEDLVSSDNEFYPMTWDQAFMFPMLEMARKGHFRFIPDVLYLYKETPQNDYKVDYSLMARLEKEIRSKRKYKALDKVPVQKSAGPVDLIVFSKDRPLQLYAHLESVYAYLKNVNSIQVIYHAANADYATGYEQVKKDFPEVVYMQQNMKNPKADFKQLTLQALNRCTTAYMMFGVDDIIVKDFCDLNECAQALARTHAYAFYLRLGLNISECYSVNLAVTKQNDHTGLPSLIHLYDDIYAWKFNTGLGDWGYAHSVDMTIARTSMIKKQIARLEFHSPNTLEGRWSMIAPRDKYGLCFALSVIVNLPLNLVQKDWLMNRHGHEYSAQDLHALFKQNKKIDINPLFKIKNKAPHMDYTPTFIERD